MYSRWSSKESWSLLDPGSAVRELLSSRSEGRAAMSAANRRTLSERASVLVCSSMVRRQSCRRICMVSILDRRKRFLCARMAWVLRSTCREHRA